MATKPLDVNRGTSYTRSGTFSIDGVPTSLVGAIIGFTMKSAESDSDTTANVAAII